LRDDAAVDRNLLLVCMLSALPLPNPKSWRENDH
jgi:hypothetical protein